MRQNHRAHDPQLDLALETGFAGSDILGKQTAAGRDGSRFTRLDKGKTVAC